MAFQREEVSYAKRHDVGDQKRACPLGNHCSLFLPGLVARRSKFFVCCVRCDHDNAAMTGRVILDKGGALVSAAGRDTIGRRARSGILRVQMEIQSLFGKLNFSN
jgi:hypothetical protein